MMKQLIPVIVGVLLTSMLAVMGTATNTLFDVYADTQVIRAEMVNTTSRIDKHDIRLDKIEDRLIHLETLQRGSN